MCALQGFKKVRSERWEFANEFFLKGQKHLLKNIKRKNNSYQHQTISKERHWKRQIQQHRKFVGIFMESELDAKFEQLMKDENTNMREIYNLKQQIQFMEKRIRERERKHQEMMGLIARILQKTIYN